MARRRGASGWAAAALGILLLAPGGREAPPGPSAAPAPVTLAHVSPGSASSARTGAEQESGAEDSVAVAIEPSEVVAGMFYVGATIRVSAVVPQDAEVAVVCEGTAQPLTLNRKGKALGLLWMNVGQVSFPAVPDLYLLRTSAPVAALAPDSVLREHGVGLPALSTRCGSDSARAGSFDELVKLKERDGLWDVAEGTVRLQPAEDGTALATVDFALPARVRPGSYQVVVHTFGHGHDAMLGRATLVIRRGGMSEFIASLAARHGTTYGVMAASIAVAVGLLTGLFFGMGSKHGH